MYNGDNWDQPLCSRKETYGDAHVFSPVFWVFLKVRPYCVSQCQVDDHQS